MRFNEGAPDWIPLYWLLRGELVPKVNVEVAPTSPPVNIQLAPQAPPVNVQVAPTDPLLLSEISRIIDAMNTVQTIDRKGKVFLADSFESGMGCWKFNASGGAVGFVTRTNRRTGLQAYGILLPTTTSSYELMRSHPLPMSGRVGAEISVAMNTPRVYVDLTVLFYEADHCDWISFELSPYDQWIDLYIPSEGGWYDTVYNYPVFNPNEWYWHTIKVTMNRDTGKYEKLTVGGVEVDISGYNSRDEFGDEPSMMIIVNVSARSTMAANSMVWLDDIIITEEA